MEKRNNIIITAKNEQQPQAKKPRRGGVISTPIITFDDRKVCIPHQQPNKKTKRIRDLEIIEDIFNASPKIDEEVEIFRDETLQVFENFFTDYGNFRIDSLVFETKIKKLDDNIDDVNLDSLYTKCKKVIILKQNNTSFPNLSNCFKKDYTLIEGTEGTDGSNGSDNGDRSGDSSGDGSGNTDGDDDMLMDQDNYCPNNSTGLRYKNNSCYQDSVLHALFTYPNPLTEHILSEHILSVSLSKTRDIRCPKKDIKNIQNELRKIYEIIHGISKGPYDVTKLRALINKCPGTDNFQGDGMMDAGEYLNYLLKLFPFTETVIRTEAKYGTNDKNKLNRLDLENFEHKGEPFTYFDGSPIIDLNVRMLKDNIRNEIELRNMINQRIPDTVNDWKPNPNSDSTYNHIVTVINFKKAPCLIFSAYRLDIGGFYRN